ncbi:MAG: carbohydrate ABC transporter permease, partial [Spirochaetes bacterium]
MKRKPLWPVPILYVIMLVWIIPVVGILVMSVRPSVEIMRGWW